MKPGDFDQLFSQFSDMRVGVIGDLMLDTYWWGSVDRISPEAPVPVVALKNRERRIGGAGNVALNIASLGATVFALGVIGKDEEGGQLRQLLKENKIGVHYLAESQHRPTSTKVRVISRNQHMLRLDSESTEYLNTDEEAAMLKSFGEFLQHEQPQLIIFEDYNKGVLSPRVIATCLDMCKEKGIITAVDPKRKNFFEYRGVDIFKPNLQEARDGLNLPHDPLTPELLNNMHGLLNDRLHNSISLITLSERGVFFQKDDFSRIIPTHVRNIADVSGAGDTVIAVAALVYAATKDVELMAEMANIAGGVVCEQVGTVAIDPHTLKNECMQLLVKETEQAKN